MAVEIVWDVVCQYSRLWITEPMTVVVLNKGSDWETVRERVKMFSRPTNNPSGCLTFASAILGLPIIRYMGVDGGGMVATAGNTALRLSLCSELAAELDNLAEKHGLYSRQQAAPAKAGTSFASANASLISLREVPVTDWNLSAFLGQKFGTMVQVSFFRDGTWSVITESRELDTIDAQIKLYLENHK